MIEIFKDIPGVPGYQVSNLGRVKSLPRWVERKRVGRLFVPECVLSPDQTGEYHRVILCPGGGVKKRFCVHQLVAMAFLNHKPNGYKITVDHINGIKTDNRAENLRLVTQRENVSSYYRSNRGTSQYLGVFWHKKRKRWIAHIHINGKQKHLGTFQCEHEAAKAYQHALNQIKNG